MRAQDAAFGSQQRAGACPGLSSYNGAASIANARKLALEQ
jgi:hypothetical protein